MCSTPPCLLHSSMTSSWISTSQFGAVSLQQSRDMMMNAHSTWYEHGTHASVVLTCLLYLVYNTFSIRTSDRWSTCLVYTVTRPQEVMWNWFLRRKHLGVVHSISHHRSCIRIQPPREMGIYHIPTTLLCLYKRRLPTRLYAICITVTMTLYVLDRCRLWQVPWKKLILYV